MNALRFDNSRRGEIYITWIISRISTGTTLCSISNERTDYSTSVDLDVILIMIVSRLKCGSLQF